MVRLFREHSGLFWMLASLVVLIAVICSLVMVPALRQIGRGSIEETTSRLQRGRNANIEVTGAPYTLADYMQDIEVKEGQTVELRHLIPSVVTQVPDILTETGIRIYIGEAGEAYEFALQWDSDSHDTELEFTLYDCLERPLECWQGISGHKEIILYGGLYKLTLSCRGVLGENFSLVAQAARTAEKPEFDAVPVSGIPDVQVQMSEAMFQSWDVQRASYLKALETQTQVDTANFKPVLANLTAGNATTAVQLWEAGIADPVHFSEDTPSFTGKVVSGPLLFGMSQFKLYTIKTQEGLLNYVVGSIMYDEGIFVPRNLLVCASLNRKSLGLYLLVETPKSQGFFAGVGRYDGQVVGLGELDADPAPAAGLQRQRPIEMDQDFFLNNSLFPVVNRSVFAKSLALITRFAATHATQLGDFRLYRHPYLDSPEPVIRDMNVDVLLEEGRPEIALLTHTSWWLGARLVGAGAFFNPKIFPMDSPLGEYSVTPWTIWAGSVHPAAFQFVWRPENREIFDRYLFYACDGAFQQRFAARMQSAFAAALPFLDDGTARPFKRLPGIAQSFLASANEISWVKHQVEVATSRELIVPHTVPWLLDQSALLIDTDLTEMGNPGEKIVSLYNFSPFSARLRLPDYAQAVNYKAPAQDNYSSGLYLAPSSLFPTVASLAPGESPEKPLPIPFTRESARRFLGLERVRFRSRLDSRPEPAPFIDVVVPEGRLADFISSLKQSPQLTIGGTYALDASRSMLLSELPSEREIATQHFYWDFDRTRFGDERMTDEGSALPRYQPGKTGNGAFFNGASNFVRTSIDVSDWPQLTVAFWLKLEPEHAEKLATVIDFRHTADTNGAIQITYGPDPKKAALCWLCAGQTFGADVPTGEWQFITATASRATGKSQLFINGQLIGEADLPSRPFNPGAIMTVGRFGSAPERYFHGMIDGLLVSARPLPELSDWLKEQTASSAGPATEPDIVILPLGLEQTDKGHRLSLLISNFSQREISLDLNELSWWQGSSPVIEVPDPRPEMPYRIHAIWELGQTPERMDSPQITLDAVSFLPGMTAGEQNSAMLWTGALRALLAGPSDAARPDAVLVEIDFEGFLDNPWVCFNGEALAKSASASSPPVKVVIHEPMNVYLPTDESRLPGYQEYFQNSVIPVNVTASNINQPHENENNLIDNDIGTYWHVKVPPESSTHWVAFDLGQPVTITGLAILPRKGFSDQMWDKEHTVIQGSDQPERESGWVSIDRLFADKAALINRGWSWLSYHFENDHAYRYYRLLIDDPDFMSLSEVRFFTRERPQPVDAMELTGKGVMESESPPGATTKILRFKDKDTTISDIVNIPSGYILEIEPGSTLKFTTNAGLLSYSPIRAIGTAEEPITLSPAEGNADWAGVAVVGAPEESEFRHVRMSQAAGGAMGNVQFSGGLTFMKTSVIIADTQLSDFVSEDGLHLPNSKFEISGLNITGSKSDGLDTDWGCGTINNSVFHGNGGDGVDLCGSWATITNCLTEGSADKGISIGEGSVARVTGVKIIGNRTGVAAKDQSLVSLTNCQISDNEYGVLRYIKKPIYVYPEMILENNQFHGNSETMHEEEPQSWTRRFD